MASVETIAGMIAGIKTVYPYYSKGSDDATTLVKMWRLTLNEYSDDIVKAAFVKCLQTCKQPPTPADVIEQIGKIAAGQESSPEELWAVYYDALVETMRDMNDFGFTFVDPNGLTQGENARRRITERFEKLPPRIRQYLATERMLMQRAAGIRDGQVQYERGSFISAIKRIHTDSVFRELPSVMLEVER